jgi:hypothetical protein
MYAIKVLQKQAIMKRNEVKHIMSERNVLLKNIIHPFLVGLHTPMMWYRKYCIISIVRSLEDFFYKIYLFLLNFSKET